MHRPPVSHVVSARAVRALVDCVARAELPTATLFDDLSFDASTLRRQRLVSWDDYATICERGAALVGGDDALADLAEQSYHEVVPELRIVARALIAPMPFLRFMLDVLDPLLFPVTENRFEDLGNDQFRVTTHLRQGARPCLTFFSASVGAFRGVTRHLDLPPVQITRADVSATHGVYEGTVPASQTLVSRATRVSLAFAQRTVLALLLGDDHDVAEGAAPDALTFNVDVARADWGLTRRQVDVLRHVVQGKTNKEVASALGCADNTVELHLTQILRKARVSSRAQLIARFWAGG